MTDVDRLLQTYIERFEAGDATDPSDLLDQAKGPDRARLSTLIEGYLEHAAPPQQWDAEAFEGSVAMRAAEMVAGELGRGVLRPPRATRGAAEAGGAAAIEPGRLPGEGAGRQEEGRAREGRRLLQRDGARPARAPGHLLEGLRRPRPASSARAPTPCARPARRSRPRRAGSASGAFARTTRIEAADADGIPPGPPHRITTMNRTQPTGTRSTACSGVAVTPEELEDRAEALLAEVPDYIWNGESLPVPIEEIADTHVGLLVRDVADLTTAPGAPELAPDQSLSGLLLASKGEIWVNASEGKQWPPRRRFTIGHELGHWRLHREPGQQSLFCRKAKRQRGRRRSADAAQQAPPDRGRGQHLRRRPADAPPPDARALRAAQAPRTTATARCASCSALPRSRWGSGCTRRYSASYDASRDN